MTEQLIGNNDNPSPEYQNVEWAELKKARARIAELEQLLEEMEYEQPHEAKGTAEGWKSSFFHVLDQRDEARERAKKLQAAADQAISDLQGVANLSVDSESHDEIVTIVQHVAAQFAEMKEDS